MLTATGDATTAEPRGLLLRRGQHARSGSPRRWGAGCWACASAAPSATTTRWPSWTQEDFWGLAAFFAGTGNDARAAWPTGPRPRSRRPTATRSTPAKFLEGPAPQFTAGRSPRAVLADWLATPKNRYFAANIVNRVWQDLCGTGLVSTIDDLDTLDARGAEADPRRTRRQVRRQRVQPPLAGRGHLPQQGVPAGQLGERRLRLGPAAGADPLAGPGVRRRSTRRSSLKKGRGLSPRYTPEGQNLKAQLEEARGTTPTDFRAGIPQALLLMNGSLVTQATTLEDSMTLRAVVDAPFLKDTEKLDTLFLAAYSRLPRADERERFLKVVRAKPDARGPAAGVREHLLGAAEQSRIRPLSLSRSGRRTAAPSERRTQREVP